MEKFQSSTEIMFISHMILDKFLSFFKSQIQHYKILTLNLKGCGETRRYKTYICSKETITKSTMICWLK